jgi:hypothetical protein
MRANMGPPQVIVHCQDCGKHFEIHHEERRIAGRFVVKSSPAEVGFQEVLAKKLIGWTLVDSPCSKCLPSHK